MVKRELQYKCFSTAQCTKQAQLDQSGSVMSMHWDFHHTFNGRVSRLMSDVLYKTTLHFYNGVQFLNPKQPYTADGVSELFWYVEVLDLQLLSQLFKPKATISSDL